MRVRSKSTLLGLALSLAAVGSRADTITATFTGVKYQSTVGVQLTKPNAYSASGYVGGYQWTATGSNLDGVPQNFLTFCIEVNQDINFNTQYTYNVVPLTQAPSPGVGVVSNPTAVGPMDANQANLLGLLWGQDFGKVNNADSAAAFQYAVWDVVYGGYDTTNHFVFGQNITLTPQYSYAVNPVTTALNWLNALDANGSKASLVALSSPGAGGAQDQIVVGEIPGGVPPPPTVAPLPSTATAGMGVLGLLGLGRLVAGRRGRRVAIAEYKQVEELKNP